MTSPDLDTQVIVVGAGPVGLLLAGELRLGGADIIVLDRLAHPTTESRASTLHARTMEILDSRGMLDELGTPPREPMGHFGGIPLDLTTPSRFAGQWKVPQTRTEELLADRAWLLGADVRRCWALVGLAEEPAGVTVVARNARRDERLRAAYVVACDGQDSTVRGLTGTAFPGQSAGRHLLRADVDGIDVPNRRFERLPRGVAIAARGPSGVTRVMVHEYDAGPRPADFTSVTDAWKRVTGEDISAGRPLWVGSFDDTNRQVARYRSGRVLYAGDAAHRQLPSGGQALNLGLQDAFNLGWKLAAVVTGQAPAELLDTYHDERHAVGARVLANIRTQARLLFGGPDVEPLRALLTELITLEPARAHLAGMISGVDVRYDVGGDHPLSGTWLPHTRLGTTTTTALPRTGQGLFLAPDGSAPVAAPWSDRVAVVPAARALPDASCVLVRPDGHIAWCGNVPADATSALHRWFGPPSPK
jgi:oxygenase